MLKGYFGRIIRIAIIFALVLCMPVATHAKGTLEALVAEWEEKGYPDNVGFVCWDDVKQKRIIGLVDSSKLRIKELRSKISDIENVEFETSQYSHNELMAVQEEITEEMFKQTAENTSIYSVGTGWAIMDGVAKGFGRNGHEERVCVKVDKGVYEEYATKYKDLYGDKVYLEAGEQAVNDLAVEERAVGKPTDGKSAEGNEVKSEESVTAEKDTSLVLVGDGSGIEEEATDYVVGKEVAENSGMENQIDPVANIDPYVGTTESNSEKSGNEWFPVYYIGYFVTIVAVVLAIWLINRNRLVLLKQSVNGESKMEARPLKRKEIVSSVKETVIEPRDGVGEEILKKMEEDE